jgi:hypothetical protein
MSITAQLLVAKQERPSTLGEDEGGVRAVTVLVVAW